MYQTISHYRLLEPLGSGGEGQVWKAEDLRLKRTVAIKFVKAEQVSDDQSNDRFRHEAQMSAALNHPNIAAIYELGEIDDRTYIAMECVDGENLSTRLQHGPLDLDAVIGMALQVVDGLAAAHSRGLLHCDIKSSNIVITPGGLVKILDFGLARLKSTTILGSTSNALQGQPSSVVQGSPDQKPSGLLSVTEVSGTAAYMSPEQVRGEVLDERTDIFSFGVVLYEMITASQPFHGDTPAKVLNSILNEEPLPLSSRRADVPLELESILRRLLAKDRNARYASAEALRHELIALKRQLDSTNVIERRLAEAATTESPTPAAGPPAHLQPLASRFRTLLLIIGVVAVSIALWEVFKFHGTEWKFAAALLVIVIAALSSFAAARKKGPMPVQALSSGAAFRGLLPFQEADRRWFYGREPETAALLELIGHADFRFGVLFGESGCGKTSLLRAGLLPRLWEEGYVAIYCRSYKDPLAAAVDEFRKRSQVRQAEGETSVEYLKRVAADTGGTLVIICDQFEEFFISHRSREEREPFVLFIEQCDRDRTLPVKFLVSMRSDFLYLVHSELGGRIAEPLMSSRLYHLRNFDEAHAVGIIERSAHRAGLPFEAGLPRQIARDLSSAGTVSPSDLQIVGEQVQSKRIYTLQAYRLAGGKESIVHGFLEDVIQASGDADGARLLLRSIISEENTRLTLALDEIARRTLRSEVSVARLLKLFSDARLVREVQEDDPWRYELMHEYLIDRINQVTGRVMDATQRANRSLRQYVSNYTVDKRTRVPLSKLWFIRRYSDVQRDERERELLRKSLKIGLFKASALVVLLAAGATAAAAALSITDEWESVRLSDGHTAAVRRAAFSPDGTLLVSCGEDKKIIVWDFARRQRLATLTDHDGIVTAVAFSPDGKWFATASADKTVIVWDRVRFEKAFILRGHTAAISSSKATSPSRFTCLLQPTLLSAMQTASARLLTTILCLLSRSMTSLTMKAMPERPPTHSP